MAILHGLVLLIAIVAILRDVALLPALIGYLRGTRVRDFEKEATPRMRLLVQAKGGLPDGPENAVAALRQNYPPFQAAFFFAEEDQEAAAAAQAAREAVTDLAGDDAEPPRLIAAVSAAARPDPLFLRDVAHTLIDNEWVGFPSVVVGAEGRGAQLVALTANVERFGAMLMGDGRFLPTAALGARATLVEDEATLVEHLDQGAMEGPGCLGRRPLQVRSPEPTTIAGARDEIAARMRPLKRHAPVLFHLWGVHAIAPALCLLALPTGGVWTMLAPFLLLLLTRVATTLLVDLKLCRDLSTTRALKRLPLLWIHEPLAWWAAFAKRETEKRPPC